MFEDNSIIKASAGTGKTFALATRFIRLLLLDRVRPETIVALTFSRAAAQEIYTKILVRLCEAAESEAGAAREWDNLLEDFRRNRVLRGVAKAAEIEAAPPPHSAADFGRLLRALVETQHLGAIATLDSFILKIVRNFPKEMGFQNAVSVLDSIDESAAVDGAIRAALSKTDGSARAVAEAFTKAQRGEYTRQCLPVIGDILNRQGWRNFVLANPSCADWTVESMCAELGMRPDDDYPDLSWIPVNQIPRANATAPEATLIEKLRQCDGSEVPFFIADKKIVGDMARFFWSHPEATEYAYSYYRRDYVFNCGLEGAAALRKALSHAVGLYLRRQLEIVRAKIDLVLAVEGEYGKMTRRMGRLTFGDFTKYSAEDEFSARGIAIRNVEFRFDSRFDHWALDEFQDTSELQWRCLRELVQNAADAGRNGEGRSVMAVGDMKQSIYAWRGASARPFEELSAWPAFVGCERNLSESHRYGPFTADFVNRVFGPDNIRTDGLISAACSRAVEAWRAGWVDHVSHQQDDYVKVVPAAAGEDEEEDALLVALHKELAELWGRHEEAGSTETVGVLVRDNGNGIKVAEYLRSRGLPAIWEGMNPVGDVPIAQAVLALLKLADHPADTAAWRTANDLLGVRAILLPECADATATSSAVSKALSRQGLARTLKDFCGRLLECRRLDPEGLTAEKLRQLVELGVAFEGRAGGNDGVGDFLTFAEKSYRRECAVSPDVIRVMTIHRSKGLGIDHVFVPLFENRDKASIDIPKMSAPLFDGGKWVLAHLTKGCEQFNDRTRLAYGEMRSEKLAEALRTYYVALTRSKRSLCVICPDDSNADDIAAKGLLMRDLIINAVGGELPYEAGVKPQLACKVTPPPSHREWPLGRRFEAVERVSPSGGMHRSMRSQSAGGLFDESFGVAAQRGVEVHAAFQAIEWADEESAAKLPEAFRAAFVRPCADAAVWRERSYELFAGGRWETGQFDRVVFSGREGSRSAAIYDFKTNAMHAGESEEQFVVRMRERYAAQMDAYRKALTRLTGIPAERITAQLLLTSVSRSVLL